jgi:hypothetical protein
MMDTLHQVMAGRGRILPMMLLAAILLTTPAEAEARRAIRGPSEVHPGVYAAFRVVGFPRHRHVFHERRIGTFVYNRGIYTTIDPAECPALDTCVNGVGRSSRVSWRGRSRVEFQWPKTFVGFDANMVYQRYAWSDQARALVKVCTFPGPPRCARKVVRVTPAELPPSTSLPPSIARLRWRARGVNPGRNYFVRETIRVRACAPRGPLTIHIAEQKLAFDDTVQAKRSRNVFQRQSRRCQLHTVSWKLGDRFFGIGKYVVRTTVIDAFGRESPPVSRSSTTTD